MVESDSRCPAAGHETMMSRDVWHELGVQSVVHMNGKQEKGEVAEMTSEYASKKLVDGLGYGIGAISAEDLRERKGADVIAKADEILNSPAILVDVDKDEAGNMLQDDGCGDGRGWIRVFKQVGDKVHEFRRSLNRYKVFGGGLTMIAAIEIGAGDARGKSPEANFVDSMAICADKGIDFGAHDGEHAHDNDCGCGAIDKNPQIIVAVQTYQSQIYAGCEALGVSTDGLDIVLDNFSTYADQIKTDNSYKGSNVMHRIISAGKVLKRLGGVHVEARIVVNKVRGKTVNQTAVREATGGEIDVFAVDMPRIVDIATKRYPENEPAQQQAIQSMVVYTLGTAAVLTKGDLPVWVVEEAKDRQPVSAAA